LSPDRRLTLYDSIRSDKQDAFFPKICNQPEATEKYRKDQVLFLKVLSGLYNLLLIIFAPAGCFIFWPVIVPIKEPPRQILKLLPVIFAEHVPFDILGSPLPWDIPAQILI